MPTRTRRWLLGAFLPLLLAGLLLGGAGHVVQHDHGEGGAPCATCHLTGTSPPEFASPPGRLLPVGPAPPAPREGPRSRRPALRLAPRAPPLGIHA